jgi:hypothetical protein
MWAKLNIDPVCAASCILALEGLVKWHFSLKSVVRYNIYHTVSYHIYRVHNSPPLVRHETTIPKLKDLFCSSKPVFQMLHSLQVSLSKACKHISVLCLLHVHNVISLMLFYEGYKSWSSRLCCFLRPAITSSSDTLYSCLFDKIWSLMYALSQICWRSVNTLQRFRILSFNETL